MTQQADIVFKGKHKPKEIKMKLNIKAIKDGIIFYLEENSWIHQYGGIEYQGESPAACIAWAYNNNFLIINR